MKSNRKYGYAIGLVCVLAAGIIAYAVVTTTSHRIAVPVIDAGGDTIASTHYAFQTSVGQIATETAASNSYRLNTGLFYARVGLSPGSEFGDSIVIVGTGHQVVSLGDTGTFALDLRDSRTGTPVSNSIVNFEIEYEGTVIGTDTAATDVNGQISKSITFSSGEGAYVVRASPEKSPGKKVLFVVYTDERVVPVHPTQSPKSKWVMIAPMKKPDTSLTGLAQLNYGGTGIAYSYDPALASADGTFDRYKSVVNQSAAENVSSNGTFSTFEIGRAYWFRSSVATTVGLAGTPVAVTDTFSVRLSPGANMIGNPFAHFINWLDDVAVDTNPNGESNLILLRNLTPDQADASIDTQLQWRSQSAEQYVNPFAASETNVLLKPWAGMWVYANTSCSLVFYPNPRTPQSIAVRQQAAKYLADEGTEGRGDKGSWRIQIMAHSDVSEIRDEYTYIGTAPGAADGEDINDLWKAPGMSGDLRVWAGGPSQGDKGTGGQGDKGKKYAASIASPVKTATVWPLTVVAPSEIKNVTLSWNSKGLPEGLDAYLLGGSGGAVNLRSSSSVPLYPSPLVPLSLSIVVGRADQLSAFLAAPLSKDNTFAYPNPGPDAAGVVNFKYNLQATADVNIKIFDIGGKLVKELTQPGAAGSNTLTWDATNKNGQKVGSGVYVYVIQGGGNKLVDKVAIVR